MKLTSFFLFFSFLLTVTAQASNLDDAFFKLTPPEKQIFLKQFPKGGDLHFHLDGSVSPEALLKLNPSSCINQQTLFVEKSKQCPYLTAKELPDHPSDYESVVEAWSMKNFLGHTESAHDHIFNAFPKFHFLFVPKQAEALSLLRLEASEQNITYLEPMISPDNDQAIEFAKLIEHEQSLEKAIDTLLANKAFIQHNRQSVKNASLLLERSNHLLSCPKGRGCDVKIGFQYYILRELPLPQVIAEATAAFQTASESTLILGINLVMPEDGIIALRDYQKHMALIGALHKRFPKVNIALHAGELEPNAVSPEEITFHIRDAIMQGKANRIGHGTSIAYENKAEKTLAYMRRHNIPVEINLSSNEAILNVAGRMHPISLYLSKKVPVVISTDDEGILRTTLTREYFLASERYQLSYQTLKNLSRNSLTYSFLPGKSLWMGKSYKFMRHGCSLTKLSKPCETFLQESPKARQQFELEQRFKTFEKAHLDS